MKSASFYSLSVISLALISANSFAHQVPLTMVNSDSGLSCIKSQILVGDTGKLILTNDCADIGTAKDGLSVTVNFDKPPAGNLYEDNNDTTAALPYPSFSQHATQATATFKNGVWKEGSSIAFNWYQASKPIAFTGATTSPAPAFTNGKLTLSESGVTNATADIITSDTHKVSEHVAALTSTSQQVSLAFGNYLIVPYLVNVDGTLYQGSLKTTGTITLSKDNPFVSNTINYAAVNNPGHIQFQLSNSVPATSLVFYNSDYTVAGQAQLTGTGGARAVPAGTYTLPSTFTAEAQKAGSADYNRCTLTATGNTSVDVAAGQTAKASYTASCQTVSAVNVKINISNDRTLNTKSSRKLTVRLQSTSIPSAVFTKTFDYQAGQATPIISVPGDDSYKISVYADSGENDLQNYDVVTQTLRAGVKDPTLPIDFKYKGSYRYITKSQYTALLPQVNDKPSYDINIGQALNGTQVAYHCDYKMAGGKLVRDPSSCAWKGFDLKHMAAIQPKGFAHTANELAMALAQGTMLERAQLMHGFSATPSFTRSDVGNYFADNVNPNTFLSRCTQETGTCAYVAGQGPYQLNNIALQLQSATAGGFPMPYALIDAKTLSDHTAVDFIGGTLSAAMFDASDTGLITPDNMNKLAQPATADGLAFQRVMDWIYNRGTGEFSVFKNFDTCSADPHMIDNPSCFPQRAGWGTRYIRQVPNVGQVLSGKLTGDTFIKGGAITQYDSALTWKEISTYLNTLGPKDLNLYDSYDIVSAKKAARAAFNKLTIASGKSSIDFRTEFGYVLQAIMSKLPIYQYEAQIPTPGPGPGPKPGKSVTLSLNKSSDYPLYFQTTNNYTLKPGGSQALADTEHVGTMFIVSPTKGYVACGSSTISTVNTDIGKDQNPTVMISGDSCTAQ